MDRPVGLSASDVSLALSDPFGLWHDHHGDPKLKDPEDEYDIFLKEQGLRVEKELLAKRHPRFVDLKDHPFEAATERTAALMKKGNVVIYGGALSGGKMGLYGRPDVIEVGKPGTCLVEEYKLAGTPDATHKIQAVVYAHLLRKACGTECDCRIVSRRNEEFPIPYDQSEVEDAVQRARAILASKEPPYPVYNCRSRWGTLQNKTVKERQDVTLAWNVGPSHAAKFHSMGVHTLRDLAELKPEALRTIKGLGPKKVPQIVNSVKAQLSKRPLKVGEWKLPEPRPALEIFLDLEGTGELFQDDPAWNCIYLIGLIPRSKAGTDPYKSFLAKAPGDEKATLMEFLGYLGGQTSTYCLYHWTGYERWELKKACERHGFQTKYDNLILPHLRDLNELAKAAYVLPTPGWSIKVVAPYFGFEWSQDASEVDAMKSAMIWYKQAANGGNGAGLDRVLLYNEDDCRAMIVVRDGFERLKCNA